MSLTFVFAPVEVREEMAAALPVSLQPPLSYKIANKRTLKVLFVVAANKWGPVGLYLSGGGCERAASLEDVAGDGRSGGDLAPPPWPRPPRASTEGHQSG